MRNGITAAGLRDVPELRYLNADNVARYRAVMKFFYQEYQRLRYWLRPEEVYEGVSAWGVLDNYTLEQCMSDLEQLKNWQNLASRHDGGRAVTIEEYMRKKSLYLLTPYSIEIERMLETLETIKGYGGSLETTYLDTISECLLAIRRNVGDFKSGEALGLWEKLFQAFKQMHENAADFIGSMNSIQAEEMMATDAFLAMKDRLTDYLQHFVRGLQQSAYQIEGHLQQITPAIRDLFLEQAVEDEMAKPRLEAGPTREELLEQWTRGWMNLRRWFLGDDREISELQQLERATKDTIAKVVRSALRLQERKRSGVSRRKDLEWLARRFDQTESLDEAHRLAAYVFGLFPGRHLQGEDSRVRTTDRADAAMWEEPPSVRGIRSRSLKRPGKGEAEPVRSDEERKRKHREIVEAQLREERELLERLAGRGRVSLAEFGVLNPRERLRLLSWIGRCTASHKRSFVTSDGYRITLAEAEPGRRVTLRCTDGDLEMPDYTLIFEHALKERMAKANG